MQHVVTLQSHSIRKSSITPNKLLLKHTTQVADTAHKGANATWKARDRELLLVTARC